MFLSACVFLCTCKTSSVTVPIQIPHLAGYSLDRRGVPIDSAIPTAMPGSITNKNNTEGLNLL